MDWNCQFIAGRSVVDDSTVNFSATSVDSLTQRFLAIESFAQVQKPVCNKKPPKQWVAKSPEKSQVCWMVLYHTFVGNRKVSFRT